MHARTARYTTVSLLRLAACSTTPMNKTADHSDHNSTAPSGSVSVPAVHSPSLGASVVFYGPSPATETLASVKAPVLGLYGGTEAWPATISWFRRYLGR